MDELEAMSTTVVALEEQLRNTKLAVEKNETLVQRLHAKHVGAARKANMLNNAYSTQEKKLERASKSLKECQQEVEILRKRGISGGNLMTSPVGQHISKIEARNRALAAVYHAIFYDWEYDHDELENLITRDGQLNVEDRVFLDKLTDSLEDARRHLYQHHTYDRGSYDASV